MARPNRIFITQTSDRDAWPRCRCSHLPPRITAEFGKQSGHPFAQRSKVSLDDAPNASVVDLLVGVNGKRCSTTLQG